MQVERFVLVEMMTYQSIMSSIMSKGST